MIHDRILLSLALTITKDCVVESVALEINAFLGETSPKNSSPDERGIPEIANAENVAARKSPAAAAATITPCERPETILLRRCCFGNGDSAVTGHTQPLSRRGTGKGEGNSRGKRGEARSTVHAKEPLLSSEERLFVGGGMDGRKRKTAICQETFVAPSLSAEFEFIG